MNTCNWWQIPVGKATFEAEVGGWKGKPGQINETLFENKKGWRWNSETQCLPSMHEGPGFIPSMPPPLKDKYQCREDPEDIKEKKVKQKNKDEI